MVKCETENFTSKYLFLSLGLFLFFNIYFFASKAGFFTSFIFGIYSFTLFSALYVFLTMISLEDLEVSFKNIYKNFKMIFLVSTSLFVLFISIILHFYGIYYLLNGIMIGSLLLIAIGSLIIHFFVAEAPKIRRFVFNLSPLVLFNSLCWYYSHHGLKHVLEALRHINKRQTNLNCYHQGIICNLSYTNLNEKVLSEIKDVDIDLADFMINPCLYRENDPYDEKLISTSILNVLKSNDNSFLFLRTPFILIEDPGYQIVNNYCYKEYKNAIDNMIDQNSLEHLNHEEIKLFKYANILVKKNHIQERRDFWDKNILEQSENFHKNGFIVIKDLFHPLQRNFLQHYFGSTLKYALEKNIISNDKGEYGFTWNEIVSVHYNRKLINFANAIIKKKLKIAPPLALYYVNGSRLSFHFDYDPYQYSLSVILFFNILVYGNS